ncbi:MAG: hypothetical protein Q9P90_12530 [candidate division KSB1 bacterium]|nr:hypothetical protein [candidate division KSB1 bacterium]
MAEKVKTYDVGDEIFTYCGRCKSDMYHVITKVASGQIKKVMCKGCNYDHTYKEPAGVKEQTATKAVAEKPAKTASKRGRKKKDWESLQSDLNEEEIVEYAIDRDFSEARAIRHKKFGVGIVHKVLSNEHIEVIFKDGTRVLVHNYQMQ